MTRTSFPGDSDPGRDLADIWNPAQDSFFSRDSDLELTPDEPVGFQDEVDKPVEAHPKNEMQASSLNFSIGHDSHFKSLGMTDGAAEPAHFFNIDSKESGHDDRLDSLLGLSLPPTLSQPVGSLPVDPKSASTPPKLGDTFCGFLLLSVLGKGAFATVYLAEQLALGRRLVALKVSKAEGEEPQILAKLQHTHIVPIYSVYDDANTGLRLLCMPYLGGANLAQILEAAGDRLPSSGESQKSLVAALDEVNRRFFSAQSSTRSILLEHESRVSLRSKSQNRSALSRSQRLDRRPNLPLTIKEREPSSRFGTSMSFWKWPSLLNPFPRRSEPTNGVRTGDEEDFDQPARLFLREANLVQSSVWVIARLAEGLEHAHSRGMYHRDLKPSNVLIARDGTPMLLDFNLSTETELESGAEREKAMLGGTLPYMSPEHIDAFDPDGVTSADAVTERSDIYAMGLILFEMLAGAHPFPEPPGRLPLLDTLKFLFKQRQTIPSIRSIRPGVPWSIDAILRKCLAPDPGMRYGSARELSEDLSRFLDDLPLKHTKEPSLKERWGKWKRRNPRLCGSGSIAIFTIVAFMGFGLILSFLSSNMQTLAARVKYQSFETNVTECRFLLNLQSGPSEHLKRGIVLVGKTLESEEIGQDSDFLPRSWVKRLTVAEQRKVREQTSELILLQARSKVELAQKSKDEHELRRTLEQSIGLLESAERIDPKPPAVLYSDLARYHSALGRADLAAKDRDRERRHTPTTARDFQLLGSSRLAGNQIPQAEAALRHAVDLDPQSYWSWFSLGHCHFEQGRYLEAAGDFAACISLEPKFPWSFMNRGLALARSGRLSEARDCYYRAIELNPRFAEAWVNLSLTQLELNDLAEAERAIGTALSLGRKETSLLAILGEIKARLGKTDEAEQLYGQLLEKSPHDLDVLNARGIFRIKTNRQAAIADFNQVIAVDPNNARAHFGLALIDRKSDPEKALKNVEIALKTDPNFLDALQLRALTKARLGIVSAVDDAEKLAHIETANRLYNASCALSLLSEKVNDPAIANRALDFLERSVDLGFNPKAAMADADLKAIASSDRFKAILIRQP